jgi:hypothetical protein
MTPENSPPPSGFFLGKIGNCKTNSESGTLEDKQNRQINNLLNVEKRTGFAKCKFSIFWPRQVIASVLV